VQKPPRPPFPIPSLRVGLAAPKPLPLPLAPTWLGARFPALDSVAPRRKLLRSRHCPALSGELRLCAVGFTSMGASPPFCSLLLQAAGACHGPRRPPCGLPHCRPPSPRGFSTASMLPRRSGTVQPPSPHLVGAPRHGDALCAHLIACTPR
jgi:hypothetical protein